MAEIGMPRKVLRRAHELGVHTDCIASGKPCAQCEPKINAAFDHFYGSEPTLGDALGEIMKDFREDLEDGNA